MKRNLLYTFFSITALALLSGCGDDDGEPVDLNSEVLIVNEGSFSAGNGSLSSFNLVDAAVAQDLYTSGGIIQGARAYNGRLYITVNNSDKLDILDIEDLTTIASISTGLDNPIDFAAIGNKGFVSCWGDIGTAFSSTPDSYIAVIDLTSNTLVDSIMFSSRPQRLIALKGKIFVANEGGNTVSVINPDDLSVSEIAVSAGPSTLVVDKDEDIWVLSTTNVLEEINATNNTTTGVKLSDLTTSGFNEKMAINGDGDVIYFLGGSNETFTGLTTVYKVDISSAALSAEAFIRDGFALSGIGVNPDDNQVFVTDNNAFQSTGTGFRYTEEGILVAQFAVGVGPNNFLFK